MTPHDAPKPTVLDFWKNMALELKDEVVQRGTENYELRAALAAAGERIKQLEAALAAERDASRIAHAELTGELADLRFAYDVRGKTIDMMEEAIDEMHVELEAAKATVTPSAEVLAAIVSCCSGPLTC